MGWQKTVGIGVGAVLGGVILLVAGGYGAMVLLANSESAVQYDVHRVDFPIPFPLTAAEVDTLRAEKAADLASQLPPAAADAASGSSDPAEAADAGPPADPLTGIDLDALAKERAIGRGKHLVEALYPCGACHGDNFGGGVMVDDFMIGRMLGANLTTGKGSATLDYAAADWDRIVRHGVTPKNVASPMPAKDFYAMSDRELSDIVSYIRSLPPVDNEVPKWTLGPLGNFLVASGAFVFSARTHPTDHVGAHIQDPPEAVANAEYGAHLAQTCTGCHRREFNGGPIVGGPPDWPAAANLTTIGKRYSAADFDRALREGKGPDGNTLRTPMDEMPKIGKNMTETEMSAMWAYLSTLSALPDGT